MQNAKLLGHVAPIKNKVVVSRSFNIPVSVGRDIPSVRYAVGTIYLRRDISYDAICFAKRNGNTIGAKWLEIPNSSFLILTSKIC